VRSNHEYRTLGGQGFAPKSAKTLAERGVDFADAEIVSPGVSVEIQDTRKDCGETRIICYGHLEGRMVVVVGRPSTLTQSQEADLAPASCGRQCALEGNGARLANPNG
jgi:hypothetical protein